jgi:hypothetical protein
MCITSILFNRPLGGRETVRPGNNVSLVAILLQVRWSRDSYLVTMFGYLPTGIAAFQRASLNRRIISRSDY